MGLWSYIIANTSQSPRRLAVFGAVLIGGTWAIGSVFSQMTASMDAKQRKEAEQKLSYDGKRVVSAQQQRLSSMLRDMAEGRSDDHWNAAMKGTLIPHPGAESKTEAIDRERLARALSSAKK